MDGWMDGGVGANVGEDHLNCSRCSFEVKIKKRQGPHAT